MVAGCFKLRENRNTGHEQRQAQAVNAKAADWYRYINFDQIAAFKAAADTMTM
ncbi:MAG: hypothetical protein M0Q22_08945 [Sulfuritalea sp.]|jgi:aconitate hydratase 2/2-methylisocitrate dehydratase|nr:hypothetical protein [Sulfuritalea sp.]